MPRSTARMIISACAAMGLAAAPVFSQVAWRSARDAGLPAPDSTARIAQAQAAAGYRHIVARFDAPVGPEVREAARAAGLKLLSYVGDNSYFAVLSTSSLDPPAIGRITQLRGLQAIEPEHKLHPMLAQGAVPHWAVVARSKDAESSVSEIVVGAYIVFHPDVEVETEGAALCVRHGAEVRALLTTINAAVIELPHSRITTLATEDAVQWIEPPLPKMSEVNDSNRSRVQAGQAQAAPYNLTGSGVNVLVYDGGTGRSSHVDFQGRLFVRDSSGTNYHATHVCGTVGGAGIANSAYKGMAPGVTIQSYGFQYDGSGTFLYSNPGDLQSDYQAAINTYGAVLSNNSIGTNVEPNGFDCALQGNYGVTDQLIDNIVRGSLGAPFRIIWAAGNERQGSRCDVEGYGDYYSSAPPAGAKNHICVGALNSNDDSMTSFSSWGPTDDGRMKPDISAPGCQSDGDDGVTSCDSSSDTAYQVLCGTSMASPTVTGCSALMIEDFIAQYPDRPLFRNSTLKIWLAHTAIDLGNVGPDYQYGYGSIRIKDAIDFMRTGSFREESLAQAETYTIYIPVNAGVPVLKVTLAWDDYPGTPNVNPALVNDLDLRVYDPSTTRRYPWTLNPTNPSAPAIQTAEDHLNNIEQVMVSAPAAGLWRVEVYGYSIPQGPQPFSLCASPSFSSCTSQGMVALDSAQYACTDIAGVSVVDCDLNTNDALTETVTVTVTSTSEPTGESVLLTETGPASASFFGTIALSPINSPGVLQVADAATITAHYLDADDGQGGTDVEVTASAQVDCQPPVISNVQVTGIGAGVATITFGTNEPANGTVRYGLSCGTLSSSTGEAGYTTTHSINLSALPSASQIFFAVDAVDPSGNQATDDSGGSCYSFMTPAAPAPIYSWNMSTNPNWTISGGAWAWGTPTGGGGSAGNPDPSSGYTGSNVYGYNLTGDYSNNMPEYHLTTTAIDCSSLSQVSLKFWRWLGVQRNSRDHAYLRVSTNGSTWTTLWENPSSSLSEEAWSQQSYDLSAVADSQPTLYIRWTMGTTNDSRTYCGWNIDDVEIWGVAGGSPETTPPTPDPLTFLAPPAPSGTTSVAMTATTATDAESPPVAYYFDFVAGGPGGTDSTWQATSGYVDIGLTANTAYTYRVKARDSAATPNETGYSSAAETATFIEAPAGLAFGTTTVDSIVLSVSGTLTNLTTGSSGVYFDSITSGGDGGINEWVQTTTDTATGLSANTAYSLRVKARNQNGIETDYCTPAGQVTRIQTPTGVTFSTVTANSIALNAEGPLSNLGLGSSGVYFDSLTPGGDGGINDWVQTPADSATGLSPNTNYTFQAKARNQTAVETEYSPSSAVWTLALVPAAPALSDPGTETMSLDIAPGGNPAPTEFAVRCTAASPPDVNWTDNYVSAVGTPTPAAIWQTDATWGSITVSGLQPDTTYTFAVKARNGDYVETDFGPGANLATLPLPTGACCDTATGVCTIETQALCAAGGRVYQGDGAGCDPNPCEQPCLLLGDLNMDGEVNGLDVPGFVRAKLGEAPLPGENPACADYGGDLNADLAAFVADLLG